VAAHPHSDQASVYRTIALFKTLAVVQDVISGGHKLIELTDAFDSHHHHISCSSCGRSISVEDPKLERYLTQLATAHGITPQSHQIEVTGLCQDCSDLKAQTHA
jgi:Fe2+ or Zn2+ uptake regulation protein